MLVKCPKYKLNVDEKDACQHCEWNVPITFSLKIRCTHPRQLIWTEDFKIIKEE